jgi:NitT/TauT family transport system substrate-binding protein
MTNRLRFADLFLAFAFLVAPAAAYAADAPIRLEVRLGDVSLNKWMYLVAADTGIYEKNGLDVVQFITPRAAEVVRKSGVLVPQEYVRAGEGDDVPITIDGGSPRIVAMTRSVKAVDRVIIATTDNKARFHIMTPMEITEPAQLNGKRIGYSEYGAITHLMAISFAERMGWNPDRDVSLMGDAGTVEALAEGKVAGMVADEIRQAVALKQGFRDLVDLSRYDIPIAGSGINAERAWLATNRETARRFVKATIEAIARLKTDKEAAFAALAKWYGMTDRAQQEAVYRQVGDIAAKPYPAVEGIKRVMQVYDYHEMRRHKAEDFYDASFVTELDKSGAIDALYKK